MLATVQFETFSPCRSLRYNIYMTQLSRWFLTSISIALTLLALTSCVVSDDAPTPQPSPTVEQPFAGTTLRFLTCCEETPQFAALRARTETVFTEQTGITVEWTSNTLAALREEASDPALLAEGGYDLVTWVDTWGPQVKPSLVSLDEAAAQIGVDLSDFPPAYIEAARDERGVLLGLPLRGHPMLLFYRADLLNELGLTPPRTWQGLVTTGQAIDENSGLDAISLYYGVDEGQNLFLWLSMLWSRGGALFDENWRPIFNDSVGVEVTQAYSDLLLAHNLSSGAAVSFNQNEAAFEMVEGRAAMYIGWWWNYGRLINPNVARGDVAENIGLALPPQWANGQASSLANVWLAGIPQASTQKTAAWEFLTWLTSPETERAVVLDKSDPRRSTFVANRFSVLRDEQVNELSGGLHSTAADVLASARPLPQFAEWTDVQSVLALAINDIIIGSDVQLILDQAAIDVEQVMQRAGYYD